MSLIAHNNRHRKPKYLGKNCFIATLSTENHLGYNLNDPRVQWW